MLPNALYESSTLAVEDKSYLGTLISGTSLGICWSKVTISTRHGGILLQSHHLGSLGRRSRDKGLPSSATRVTWLVDSVVLNTPSGKKAHFIMGIHDKKSRLQDQLVLNSYINFVTIFKHRQIE